MPVTMLKKEKQKPKRLKTCVERIRER